MIDRGADISWLSQVHMFRARLRMRSHTCPMGALTPSACGWQFSHEAETLFPPLMALQVADTRVEGSTLVIMARFALNMMSMTLEQLTSRRRKIVCDMVEQMSVLARSKLENSHEWDELQTAEGLRATERFIKCFTAATEHSNEYYNDDKQLGDAVLSSVHLSQILEAWPAGLQALGRKEGKSVPDLLQSKSGVLGQEGKDWSVEEVHGAIALVWISELTDVTLSGTLSQEGGQAVARCVIPSGIVSLNLEGCDVASQGKDLDAVKVIAQALCLPSCKLATLRHSHTILHSAHKDVPYVTVVCLPLSSLEENMLGADSAAIITDSLQGNTTLTSLKCATHLELAFSSYQRCDLCHHRQSYLMKERLGLVIC